MTRNPSSERGVVIDFMVKYRWLTLAIVLFVSVFLGIKAASIQLERSLVSAFILDSPEYQDYQRALGMFGNDDFILVAINSPHSVLSREALTAVDKITSYMETSDKIVSVRSLTNVRLFRKTDKGLWGSFPLLDKNERLDLLLERLSELRRELPWIDLLVSRDMKTTGLLVGLDERKRFDSDFGTFLGRLKTISANIMPPGSTVRIVGPPVVRDAHVRYNLRTSTVLVVAGFVIILAVSAWLFRSISLAGMSLTIAALSVVWTVGLMALANIRLNVATGVSFGLIIVVTQATVIHVVSHFATNYQTSGCQVTAIERALQGIGEPCLMCALTTSLGFGSLLVNDLPMIRQLGFIMSVGVLASFVLAMVVTTATLSVCKPPAAPEDESLRSAILTTVFLAMQKSVFVHYRQYTVAGGVLALLMLVGIPRIHSDIQLLRDFKDSADVVQDVNFVEKSLASVRAVDLVVTGPANSWKAVEMWKRLHSLEDGLRQLPEIERTESILDWLEYLCVRVGSNKSDLLERPDLIPQLVALTRLSYEGRETLSHFLDDHWSSLRVSVRIRNDPAVPLGDTIGKIRRIAESEMSGSGAVSVTGELAVYESQGRRILRSQLLSLALALGLVTLLMAIHFRSLALGLLSLYPNLFPLIVVFGTIGWFELGLTSITAFVAIVSIGLSVDGTIHFLTQVKRARAHAAVGGDIKEVLAMAYGNSAEPLVAIALTLVLGFLVLTVSPFLPISHAGILCAISMITALAGDLVFMPSAMLAATWLGRRFAGP